MKKLFIVLSMIAIAFSSFAQDQEVEPKDQIEGNASDALAAVRLANELIRYGYENKSAVALADALQILAENPTIPQDGERKGEAVDTTKTEGKKSSVSFDFAKVLADAKELAKGDKNLLAVIGNIEAEAKHKTRGAVNSPKYTYETVRANRTDVYTVKFRANELAEVAVIGDGDTDLDLYVYDSYGNLIKKDIDYLDNCYVSWVPKWTGNFTIKVVNRGSVYNRYVLVTN